MADIDIFRRRYQFSTKSLKRFKGYEETWRNKFWVHRFWRVSKVVTFKIITTPSQLLDANSFHLQANCHTS